eukprot:scaffold25703_cov140-Isochrysis_galbana.AAC.5
MAPNMAVAEWRVRTEGGLPRTWGWDQLQLRVSSRCTSRSGRSAGPHPPTMYTAHPSREAVWWARADGRQPDGRNSATAALGLLGEASNSTVQVSFMYALPLCWWLAPPNRRTVRRCCSEAGRSAVGGERLPGRTSVARIGNIQHVQVTLVVVAAERTLDLLLGRRHCCGPEPSEPKPPATTSRLLAKAASPSRASSASGSGVGLARRGRVGGIQQPFVLPVAFCSFTACIVM